MAEYQIKNKMGIISMNDNVLATLIGNATMECSGIYAMASKRASDGLVELLKKENLARGVKVSVVENAVLVQIYIIVQYGVNIRTVAQNIVETVKYQLENYIGMPVYDIQISVEGISVE